MNTDEDNAPTNAPTEKVDHRGVLASTIDTEPHHEYKIDDRPEPAAPKRRPPVQAEKKKSTSTLCIIITAVVTLAIVAVVCYFLFGPKGTEKATPTGTGNVSSTSVPASHREVPVNHRETPILPVEEPTSDFHSDVTSSPDDIEEPTKPKSWLQTLKDPKWWIGGSTIAVLAGIYYGYIPGKFLISDASNWLQGWFSFNDDLSNDGTNDNAGGIVSNPVEVCLADGSGTEQCLAQIGPENPCADPSKCQVMLAILPEDQCDAREAILY